MLSEFGDKISEKRSGIFQDKWGRQWGRGEGEGVGRNIPVSHCVQNQSRVPNRPLSTSLASSPDCLSSVSPSSQNMLWVLAAPWLCLCQTAEMSPPLGGPAKPPHSSMKCLTLRSRNTCYKPASCLLCEWINECWKTQDGQITSFMGNKVDYGKNRLVTLIPDKTLELIVN